MEQTIIKCGGNEVQFSRMVLGASRFGTKQPKDLAYRLLDMYYDAGGRTIETGRYAFDMMPFGASVCERTVAEWLESRGIKDKVTIMSKGCTSDYKDPHYFRLDRKNIELDLMTTLAVMRIDKLGAFFLHRDDPSRPVSEIMDVLDDIVKGGYADVVGVSNWTCERIAEANDYAEKNGKVKIAFSSILWNIGKLSEINLHDDTQVYMTDKEYAWYLESGLPVFPYTPQAVGYFSKVLVGGVSADNRYKKMDNEENRKRAERIRDISAQYGTTPSGICLAYIALNKVDGHPLFTVSNEAQMEEAIKAFDLKIPQEAFDYVIKG